MPGNHPQPQPLPEPRREKPQQKHLFPALLIAALVIGLGGWGLTRLFDDGNCAAALPSPSATSPSAFSFSPARPAPAKPGSPKWWRRHWDANCCIST